MTAPRRHVVVAGGGVAAVRLAEELRRLGYADALTIVDREQHLPYDRPPLSKAVLEGAADADRVTLHPRAWYDEHEIGLRLGVTATGVSIEQRVLETDAGPIGFGELVIATGSAARTPSWAAGWDSRRGVHTLRTLDDALALRAALATARRVLVVGAGLIGSEVASCAHARGLDVTIVEAAPLPLMRFGEAVGRGSLALHEAAGVPVRCGTAVARLEGEGAVERAVLADGRVIACDLVVAAIGADPCVAWLAGSGLDVADGVRCDGTLQVDGADGVFAIGDVASFAHPAHDGAKVRFEQWTSAVQQARLVARNLVEPAARSVFEDVNYFWSDQYDARLQFVGQATDEQDTVVAEPDRSFIEFRRDGRLVGAFGVNAAREVMTAKRAIELRETYA